MNDVAKLVIVKMNQSSVYFQYIRLQVLYIIISFDNARLNSISVVQT